MIKTSIKFNIMAIMLIIAFCFAITPITFQNDTYYTIKIGEYITENGITEMDPFSWHENLEYTFPHWAYDVIMYKIYELGGFNAIYISTIILSCILGVSIYLVNVGLNKNRFFSFVVTIGAIYLARDFIAARAQLVTFILFILEICCLEMFSRNQKKKYAVFLVLISIAIANLHVAVWPFFFVLFMPYIGEYIICKIRDFPEYMLKIQKGAIERALEDGEEKQAKVQEIEDKIKEHEEKVKVKEKRAYKIIIHKNDIVKSMIVIFIICTLTGFLTPLGTTPYTYLIKTMSGNTTQSINEHLPLTLIHNKEFMAVLIALLALVACTDIKISLKDMFLIGGLLLLTFMSKRQITMFAIIGSIAFVKLIQDFLNRYDAGISEDLERMVTTKVGRIVISGVIIYACFKMYYPKRNDELVNENTYPVQASDYILENLDVENIKLYNEYNYGSYLIFRGIPVFIDSRADLYTPEFNEDVNVFSDFLNISNMSVYYEDKFEQYGFTHLIMTRGSKLNTYVSKDIKYKPLYVDSFFIVYERNSE